MDKTAIFENQIRSLNELVQIFERQVASQINSRILLLIFSQKFLDPEEILTQWRKKVSKETGLLNNNNRFTNCL